MVSQFSPLHQFKNHVDLKFQLYNSLFTSLPFHKIDKTGILLSLFLDNCVDGFNGKANPTEIIENFFEKHTTLTGEKERADILFRFIQFVERQVVLFDALEDAAFPYVNDLNGSGTLKQLELQIQQSQKEQALADKLEDFSVKIVLTAHPTQFYPGPVLGIINDLSRSLAENNTVQINTFLQQLGKTPFLKKEKPTPFDEALSLIWYLENVFYQASGKIMSTLKTQFPKAVHDFNPIIKMGFWPGGDRDGNPFVTAEITLKVADALRSSIIKCYYLDIRRLRRRLTFKGIDAILSELESELYNNIFIPGQRTPLTKEWLLAELNKIKDIIVSQHDGLFLYLVDNLINKTHVFGLHFASLDIRQESYVHNTVIEALSDAGLFPVNYRDLTEGEKMQFLINNKVIIKDEKFNSEIVKDTIESIKAIKLIQSFNGEEGCNRYIISQCNSALNVIEVYGLFILCGWEKHNLNIDIVPLFETIDDLKNAPSILKSLYDNEQYKSHLKRRKNTQTIMVGFSDGTKDGGYLMANWGIYKAKEELTAISKEYGIDVIFFDGRGGPPARGGGKTHKFYSSLARNISNKEIQITIQGQTVSSNFGTVYAAQYYLEQLIHAGISNELFSEQHSKFASGDIQLLEKLSQKSYESYSTLKDHPHFFDYLSDISPVKFYSETNIGSRPSNRSGGKLSLKDLRAIPFVGAWSQIKQNVTGFYGVGTALQSLESEGRFNDIMTLYNNSLFFKTLIDNCEMAMKKCFFPLTEHLSTDEKYGPIWNMIYDEYQLTLKYLFQLSGKNQLMSDYPVEQLSIMMRDKIVLPLLTIQQFAIARIRAIEKVATAAELNDTYEKLVIRCSFGIINAGRNSA